MLLCELDVVEYAVTVEDELFEEFEPSEEDDEE